jgi:hypothetical protein
MKNQNRGVSASTRTLATDLDGTFIPLSQIEQNQKDLIILSRELLEWQIGLAFVTGRHFELVQEAIEENLLPHPNWIICDVGTTILQSKTQPAQRNTTGQKSSERIQFDSVPEYATHLADLVGDHVREKVLGEIGAGGVPLVRVVEAIGKQVTVDGREPPWWSLPFSYNFASGPPQ